MIFYIYIPTATQHGKKVCSIALQMYVCAINYIFNDEYMGFSIFEYTSLNNHEFKTIYTNANYYDHTPVYIEEIPISQV